MSSLQQPVLPVAPEDVNAVAASPAGELDLFVLVLLLRQNLLRIACCSLVITLLMVLFTLTAKPRYSSTASMLIPQQNTSAAGLALQAAAGIDLIGGGNEIYTDILKSRAVLDRLIAQYTLRKHYGATELGQAEMALKGATQIVSTREGLLEVTVVDTDRNLAANLANSYLVELDRENQFLAVSSAGQQRRFYEQEMVKEKDALADAEVDLKQSQEKNGIMEPTVQFQASLGATESTRAQLRAREVELGALLQSETPQNPEVIRVRAEVASLESQLHSLESQGGPEAGAPSAKAPARVLDYVRAAREVKFHETLFELLSRQYATAKEQEAKNTSMIQILDRATPAERKSWPPRTSYCIAACIAGALFGVLWAAAEKMARVILFNPRNRARYQAMTRGVKAG